jgi:DNA modification methylase
MTFKILEGRAEDRIQELPHESIDTVFTSPNPPLDYKEMEELVKVMLLLPPKLKPHGSIWITLPDYHNTNGEMVAIPERFLYEMIVFNDWHLRSKLIWHRPVTEDADEPNRWRRDYEFLYWFVRDTENYYFDRFNAGPEGIVRLCSSILEYPYIQPPEGVFASGMPEGLIRDTAIITTPPNGMILDPFTGTGTTGIVAMTYGCNFTGIELKHDYISKINARLRECQRTLQAVKS